MPKFYNYPPWERVPSRDDTREYYEAMREEINNYKESAKSNRIMAKKYRDKADEATKENKTINKRLLTLSKKQKALDEAKKAGYWSGAAAISVTILYETWKVIGFPGGRQWASWWEHEAVYGVLMWFATCMFGWFFKAYKIFLLISFNS